MAEKPPSSSDYASLLHELTLKKWLTSILSEDWEGAEISTTRLSESHERFWSWLGFVNLATTHLCRGRTRAALGSVERAVAAYPEADDLIALARNMAAHILAETDDHEGAAAQASLVMSTVQVRTAACSSLYYLGLSKLRAGEREPAGQFAEKLRKTGTQEGRALHYGLTGEMALAEKSAERGVHALEKAREILSSLSPSHPLLTPVRYSLAFGYEAMKRTEQGLRELHALINDAHGLLDWPIPYVRSYYRLGTLYRVLGDESKAAEHYEHFVRHWSEGDIDTRRVQEARSFLNAYRRRD